jgi:hypothetical protein
VQRSVIAAFQDADISVSIVWINMLENDSPAAAEKSAQIIVDPRVRHFHDPERRAGRAIAQALGGQDDIAWDIYLFYPKGSEWLDRPPMPITWMHQLMPSNWADAAHQHCGGDLAAQLCDFMIRLGFRLSTSAAG